MIFRKFYLLLLLFLQSNLFSEEIHIYQNFFFFEQKDVVNYNLSKVDNDIKYIFFDISKNGDTDLYLKIDKKIHHFIDLNINSIHQFDDIFVKIDSREINFNELLKKNININQGFFLKNNYKVFEVIDYIKLVKKNDKDFINKLIANNILEVKLRYNDDSLKERFNNVHEKPENILSLKFLFFIFITIFYIFFLNTIYVLNKKSFYLLISNILISSALAYYQLSFLLFSINFLLLLTLLYYLEINKKQKIQFRYLFILNYSFILIISLSLTNKNWCQDGCVSAHISSLILILIIAETFIYNELKLYKVDLYYFVKNFFIRIDINNKIVKLFDYVIFSYQSINIMPVVKRKTTNQRSKNIDYKLDLKLFIVKLVIGLGSSSVVLIIIFWLFLFPIVSVFNNADMLLKKLMNSGDIIFNNISNNQAEIKRKLDVIVIDLKSTNPETKEEFLNNIKYLFDEWFYPIIEDKVEEISEKN